MIFFLIIGIPLYGAWWLIDTLGPVVSGLGIAVATVCGLLALSAQVGLAIGAHRLFDSSNRVARIAGVPFVIAAAGTSGGLLIVSGLCIVTVALVQIVPPLDVQTGLVAI